LFPKGIKGMCLLLTPLERSGCTFFPTGIRHTQKEKGEERRREQKKEELRREKKGEKKTGFKTHYK